jgi:glycosyltransferase involved in cell wall biosynthesis
MVAGSPVSSNPTVHLVYPHGERVSCPDAIGRNLGKRLEHVYDVHYYNWASIEKIIPSPGDILIGHACPVPYTVFRRSCKDKRWGRVLLLSPHCHGDNYQPAFNEHVMYYCDLYLAITGNYWFQDVPSSIFSHWYPKMRHLDLAVDRHDFPAIKQAFNAPGNRRFLYIGSSAWYKNVEYLSEIARTQPAIEFAWAGVDKGLPGIKPLGWQDFSTREGKSVLSNYDFMITVGKADGNPTTILEAMAWGLIPVCSPQSGYVGYSSIPNIPLNNIDSAIKIIKDLQDVPENTLRIWQQENWTLLNTHFNWDRFADQVIDAIVSKKSPPIEYASIDKKAYMLWAELTNPFWLQNFRTKSLKKYFKLFSNDLSPKNCTTRE